MDLPIDLFVTHKVRPNLTFEYILANTDDETPQFFYDFLEFFFKDKPGSKFVNRGEFTLATSDGEHLPLTGQTEWTRSIEPGMVIQMDALVWHVSHSNYDESSCPSCSRVSDHSTTSLHLGVQW